MLYDCIKRWIKWWKLSKEARYLIKNGWELQAAGWASPRKDDFRLYTLPEAIKEETFYWQTT